MAIIGHGVDIVSISRMRDVLERQGEHFQERVFTQEERDYCRGQSDPAAHFAARFAAKEAYAKATGLGLGSSAALQVGVFHDASGRPQLRLGGEAHERFSHLGARLALLSLSHEGDIAIASVILSS